MTKQTLIATALALLAFINQMLTMLGKSPLPFENEAVTQLITALFTFGGMAYAWWNNNSVTAAAQKADLVKDALKNGTLLPQQVEELLNEPAARPQPHLLECMATQNRCYKATALWHNNAYTATRPVGIVVHDDGTANPWLKRYVQPSDDDPNREELQKRLGINRYANSWNRDDPRLQKCAHAFVGCLADGSVASVQTLPWNFPCWLSGSGKNGSYNGDPTAHIQFEICRGNKTDRAYFDRAVRGEAVALCAYLCRLYDLSPDSVCDHSEAHARGYATNHGDISAWLSLHGYTMDDFRAWVAAAL